MYGRITNYTICLPRSGYNDYNDTFDYLKTFKSNNFDDSEEDHNKKKIKRDEDRVDNSYDDETDNTSYVGVILHTERGGKIKILIEDFKSCCEDSGVQVAKMDTEDQSTPIIIYGIEKKNLLSVENQPYLSSDRVHLKTQQFNDFFDEFIGKIVSEVFYDISREKKYREKFYESYYGCVTIKFQDEQKLYVDGFNFHNGYYPHEFITKWIDHEDKTLL